MTNKYLEKVASDLKHMAAIGAGAVAGGSIGAAGNKDHRVAGAAKGAISGGMAGLLGYAAYKSGNKKPLSVGVSKAVEKTAGVLSPLAKRVGLGAAAGAGIGALAGGEGSRSKGALAGAVAGGAVGGLSGKMKGMLPKKPLALADKVHSMGATDLIDRAGKTIMSRGNKLTMAK